MHEGTHERSDGYRHGNEKGPYRQGQDNGQHIAAGYGLGEGQYWSWWHRQQQQSEWMPWMPCGTGKDGREAMIKRESTNTDRVGRAVWRGTWQQRVRRIGEEVHEYDGCILDEKETGQRKGVIKNKVDVRQGSNIDVER